MKLLRSVTLEYSPGLREQIETDCPGEWNLGNFRRASIQSRLAMLGAIAVLYRREIDLETLAVIGINGDSTMEENSVYWDDYLENGRSMGRGSLFVATLPSTPAAEAAIAVGAHGGVCYFAGEFPGADHPVLLIETTRTKVHAQLLLPEEPR